MNIVAYFHQEAMSCSTLESTLISNELILTNFQCRDISSLPFAIWETTQTEIEVDAVLATSYIYSNFEGAVTQDYFNEQTVVSFTTAMATTGQIFALVFATIAFLGTAVFACTIGWRWFKKMIS